MYSPVYSKVYFKLLTGEVTGRAKSEVLVLK